jgi:hypothetical protein
MKRGWHKAPLMMHWNSHKAENVGIEFLAYSVVEMQMENLFSKIRLRDILDTSWWNWSFERTLCSDTNSTSMRKTRTITFLSSWSQASESAPSISESKWIKLRRRINTALDPLRDKLSRRHNGLGLEVENKSWCFRNEIKSPYNCHLLISINKYGI